MLRVDPSLGPEAEAWNTVVARSLHARQQQVRDRMRETIGDRRRSRGGLEGICDAMWQGLVVVSPDLQVTYANGAAAVFLGDDPAQLTGSDMTRLLQATAILDAMRDAASGRVRRRTSIEIARQTDSGEGRLRVTVRPTRRDDPPAAMVMV